jgi:hypothetical protein
VSNCQNLVSPHQNYYSKIDLNDRSVERTVKWVINAHYKARKPEQLIVGRRRGNKMRCHNITNQYREIIELMYAAQSKWSFGWLFIRHCIRGSSKLRTGHTNYSTYSGGYY